MELKP